MAFPIKPKLWPTVFMLAALGVLISLGVWQLERREWKLDLIATIDARLNAPAVSGATRTQIAEHADTYNFRRITVTGEFDHAHELYLHAIGPGGEAGVQIITPLEEEDGTWQLVNRGFVPHDLKDPAKRTDGQVAGAVTVTGVLRSDSEPGWMTPANNVTANYWYYRDWKAMAGALGLAPETVVPMVLEADATPNPGGWPLGGQTHVRLKNDHLQYALTWFGLALTLVGVYLAFSWKRD